MAGKKQWSSEEKMAVVLSGLKGGTLKELCTEYGISDGQYYKWREEAFSSMKAGFADKRRKESKNYSWEAEKNRLLRIIGEQKVIIDLQKKIAKDLGRD